MKSAAFFLMGFVVPSLVSSFAFQPDACWGPGEKHEEPLSNLLPDCTKPPTVSVLNKGTYESLNGHRPVGHQIQGDAPPIRSSTPPPPPPPPSAATMMVPAGQQGDLFFPDPARATPSNPLSANQEQVGYYGQSPDQSPENWAVNRKPYH